MNRGTTARTLAMALAGALCATLLPLEPPIPLPVGPTAAEAATAECQDGWREIAMPIWDDPHYLLGVVPNENGPKWLLGGSHDHGQVVFKKSSGIWKQIGVPAGGTKGLNGGAAIDVRKITLAGFKNNPQMGTVGRVVGSSWASGQALQNTSTLTDAVWYKGKTWVVGTRLKGGDLRATAYRKYNGKWKRFDPPTPGHESALTATDATPGGTVWAVGWKQPNGTWNRPYIVRRTASGWKTVKHASLPSGEAVLTDVHFDWSKRGWVAGYLLAAGTNRYQAVLQRWNGSKWQHVDLPFAADRSLIVRAVVTDDQGSLWLAGAQIASGDREVRGWTATRTDGDWVFRVLDVPDDVPSEIRALAAEPDGAVAVGSVKSTMLAMESCEIEIAGTKRKIGLGSIKERRRVPIGEDEIHDDPADELPSLTIAGIKPPAIGTPRTFSDLAVVDATVAYGIDEKTKTWDGFVADFDGNGWDDIFFSRHLKLKPRLYLADENGLQLATKAGFTVVDRHGCDATDLDGNGALDIYCATGKVRGTSTGRHELSMNAATSEATVAKGARGAVDPFGRGRYVAFVDYDGDGDDDLFITNTKRRVDGLPRGNRFYKNNDGSFVPASWVGLDQSVGGRCLWSGDLDHDGDEDILLCVTDAIDGRKVGVRFYRNEKGKFVERSRGRDIDPIGDVDVAVADVTGDGRLDLIQLSTTRLRVSKQTTDGFRTIFEASTVDAIGLAVGDIDRDGLADIYVQRGGDGRNRKDYLLRNTNKGKTFKPVRIPQVSNGDADDVLALDVDHNGRTDFVVLNGGDMEGPVQLLTTIDR